MWKSPKIGSQVSFKKNSFIKTLFSFQCIFYPKDILFFQYTFVTGDWNKWDEGANLLAKNLR